MADTVERFSDRVADYDRWRPNYPPAAVTLLVDRAGLAPGRRVADVGSGTGILSQQLIDASGCTVVGVEPGEAMRAGAAARLAGYDTFTQVPGTSDATTLPDASCNLIVAAQAFHWFAPSPTRVEWQRILAPGGVAALVWNGRSVDATPFLAAYEALLMHTNSDYRDVRHETVLAETIHDFFGGNGPERHAFPHAQHFTWEGLAGRVFSSSYVPARGSDAGRVFERELRALFDTHAVDDHVTWHYDTMVFVGPLAN